MRNYIWMTAYFVKKVNLFPILDHMEEHESIVIDPWYDTIANLPLPLINSEEQEFNDLDIITKPIVARKR